MKTSSLGEGRGKENKELNAYDLSLTVGQSPGQELLLIATPFST